MNSNDAIPVGTITGLLDAMRQGQPGAADALFAHVYRELRRMAHRNGPPWSGAIDLEGTALVNEACAKMLGRSLLDIENRRHFYFLFSRAMQDVLRDELREQSTLRRGGGRVSVPLTEFIAGGESVQVDLSDLQQALDALAMNDTDGATVVTLRYFAGRSLREISELIGCSLPEVRAHWEYAQAFLREQLAPSEDE